MPTKSYRARRPLERFAVKIVQGIYQKKESPRVEQITEQIIHDARFRVEVMLDPAEAERVMGCGVERVVRNVLKGLRFTDGPYAGQRACLMVPVPGRRAGFLQFTSRANVAELEMARDRRAASARGMLISRDVLDEMVQDMRVRGADTLEQAHGAMAIGL